jgi:hypothetical protein
MPWRRSWMSVKNESDEALASRTEYLVEWVGYERPTWEPAANLAETAALDAWERRSYDFGPGQVGCRLLISAPAETPS